MMGFSRLCFEMKGLGGSFFLEKQCCKADSSCFSAEFSKQKLGYIILDVNSVFSYSTTSDPLTLGAVFPWCVSIYSVWEHSTGIGIRG